VSGSHPAGRLVFVAGLHRSGTSLVHRCLAAHPDVSGFADTGVPEDEGQHLQTVYPPAHRFGGAGLFGFAPETHLTETSPLATPESRERLLREWGRYWQPEAAVKIEKSPPNLVRTRFLQALFPDAVFVAVLRHPVAVAGATRKGRRLRLTYETLVRHWITCHAILATDAPRVRHLHVVRYERFVADPDAELARLFTSIGLPPHPSGEIVRAGVNERYFARWRSRLHLHRALDRRRTIAHWEPEVRRFGYSLVDLDAVADLPLPGANPGQAPSPNAKRR
jgi:hypothetical protein